MKIIVNYRNHSDIVIKLLNTYKNYLKNRNFITTSKINYIKNGNIKIKIIDVKTLAISDIKVIQFSRFSDERGYFTEPYRKSDFFNNTSLKDIFGSPEFFQQNESYSKPGVIRGLHFQWNPFMGKLVRTITGRMIDIVLDIRKNSPTLGKAIMYDMPSNPNAETNEWIWVPPGFAHGNVFTEETIIEYVCTGEYSPGCEAGIGPLSDDIDWSFCDIDLKNIFDEISNNNPIISYKDANGLKLNEWLADDRADNFIYSKC
jgi:dTDP-4-dehydrorhamnose 3,5-epimerase